MRYLWLGTLTATLMLLAQHASCYDEVDMRNDEPQDGSGDEDQGSGAAGNIKPDIKKMVKMLEKSKAGADLSKNLEAGARQMMHSIASKLLSHASKKVTEHVSGIISSRINEQHTRSEMRHKKAVKEEFSNSKMASKSNEGGEIEKRSSVPAIPMDAVFKIHQTQVDDKPETSEDVKRYHVHSRNNKPDRDEDMRMERKRSDIPKYNGTKREKVNGMDMEDGSPLVSMGWENKLNSVVSNREQTDDDDDNEDNDADGTATVDPEMKNKYTGKKSTAKEKKKASAAATKSSTKPSNKKKTVFTQVLPKVQSNSTSLLTTTKSKSNSKTAAKATTGENKKKKKKTTQKTKRVRTATKHDKYSAKQTTSAAAQAVPAVPNLSINTSPILQPMDYGKSESADDSESSGEEGEDDEDVTEGKLTTGSEDNLHGEDGEPAQNATQDAMVSDQPLQSNPEKPADQSGTPSPVQNAVPVQQNEQQEPEGENAVSGQNQLNELDPPDLEQEGDFEVTNRTSPDISMQSGPGGAQITSPSPTTPSIMGTSINPSNVQNSDASPEMIDEDGESNEDYMQPVIPNTSTPGSEDEQQEATLINGSEGMAPNPTEGVTPGMQQTPGVQQTDPNLDDAGDNLMDTLKEGTPIMPLRPAGIAPPPPATLMLSPSQEPGLPAKAATAATAVEASELKDEMKNLESRLTVLENAVANVEKEVKEVEKKIEKPSGALASFNEFHGPASRIEAPFLPFSGETPFPLSGVIQGPHPFMRGPPSVVSLGPPSMMTLGPMSPTGLRKPAGAPFMMRIRRPIMAIRRPQEHRLRSIFVPLPKLGSPAAHNILSGRPVTGLPFPINFIVASSMRKMLQREIQSRLEAASYVFDQPGPGNMKIIKADGPSLMPPSGLQMAAPNMKILKSDKGESFGMVKPALPALGATNAINSTPSEPEEGETFKAAHLPKPKKHNHALTPLPDSQSPSIEHDINNLQMELGLVPSTRMTTGGDAGLTPSLSQLLPSSSLSGGAPNGGISEIITPAGREEPPKQHRKPVKIVMMVRKKLPSGGLYPEDEVDNVGNPLQEMEKMMERSLEIAEARHELPDENASQEEEEKPSKPKIIAFKSSSSESTPQLISAAGGDVGPIPGGLPGAIADILQGLTGALGGSVSPAGSAAGYKSHRITLPASFPASLRSPEDVDDDDEAPSRDRVQGNVDQSKIVNILQNILPKIARRFEDKKRKRSDTPRHTALRRSSSRRQIQQRRSVLPSLPDFGRKYIRSYSSRRIGDPSRGWRIEF